MVVILPYATHELTYRRPWANYALIVGTVAAFFALGGTHGFAVAESARRLGLGGTSGFGAVTYLFVHADLAHLIGNMLALWLFGNAICARVGGGRYLPLYVALGAAAGGVHLLFADGVTIGASAAINGLVGLFLVFNPRARVSILVGWLLPPVFRTVAIRGTWFIGVWVIWDLVGALTGSRGIAYDAHLAGFLLGAAVGLGALRLRLVRLDPLERSLPDLLGWRWRSRPSATERAAIVPEAALAPADEPRRAARFRLPRAGALSAPKPAARRRTLLRATMAPSATADATEGLHRDPQFVTLICSCGERTEISRVFVTEGLRCQHCRAPLALPPDDVT